MSRPGGEARAGTPGTGEGLCRTCGGSGRIGDGQTCPDCAGTGKITTSSSRWPPRRRRFAT
ncbi:MAG: hypothetical protein EOP82_25540 [Variovorax sp.]|nr:MAG: hypothetical protein EOP82_25540 [Variovorax sp.]